MTAEIPIINKETNYLCVSGLRETSGPMKLEDLEKARAAIDDSLQVTENYFLILNEYEAQCFNTVLGTCFKKGINKLD